MGLLEQVYSSPAAVDRDRSVSIPRLLICLALFAGLIVSTLSSVRGSLSGPTPRSANPFYTTDAYLQAITGTRSGSHRVVDVMAALPKDKPLLIFEREHDSASSLLGMTLAYLAWPSDVRFEAVKEDGCDRQLGSVAPDSVAGVAFCDLPAPKWIQGGLRLGAKSRLLPLESPNERPQ